MQRYAAELRKSLRCTCCIIAIAGGEDSFVIGMECAASVRKNQKNGLSQLIRSRLQTGDTNLELNDFNEILPVSNVIRVVSQIPFGVQVILFAFGVKKEAGARERMQQAEEDLRVRIENLRLSDAATRKNSILGELLASFSGVNRHLSNVGELMQTITDEARRLLRTETAAIFLPLDEQCTAFALKACSGPAPADIAMLSDLFSRTIHHYEISRKKILSEIGPAGEKLLLIPLAQRGNPKGILMLSSGDSAFLNTQEGLQMAELFGDWVSIAMDNAEMFERVSKSQQEWENTFDSIFDPIYIIDPEYRLMKINKSLASYTMLPHQAAGKPILLSLPVPSRQHLPLVPRAAEPAHRAGGCRGSTRVYRWNLADPILSFHRQIGRANRFHQRAARRYSAEADPGAVDRKRENGVYRQTDFRRGP